MEGRGHRKVALLARSAGVLRPVAPGSDSPLDGASPPPSLGPDEPGRKRIRRARRSVPESNLNSRTKENPNMDADIEKRLAAVEKKIAELPALENSIWGNLGTLGGMNHKVEEDVKKLEKRVTELEKQVKKK